jgi:hypothetical protein
MAKLFQSLLVLMKTKDRRLASNSVGTPFGLNVMRIDPSKRFIFVCLVIVSPLKEEIRLAIRSSSPEVIGMSCHKVIPIPDTPGVKQSSKEAMRATL